MSRGSEYSRVFRNKSPTVALDGLTSHECFHGKKPDVSSLKIFGCKAFVHVPKEKRKMLDETSITCVLARYATNSKAFKFYDPNKKGTFISKDAKFSEYDCQFTHFNNERHKSEQDLLDLPDVSSEDDKDCPQDDDRAQGYLQDAIEEQAEPRCSTRVRNVPERLRIIPGDWWKDENLDCSLATADNLEPTSIESMLQIGIKPLTVNINRFLKTKHGIWFTHQKRL